jgi:hypothetical protein
MGSGGTPELSTWQGYNRRLRMSGGGAPMKRLAIGLPIAFIVTLVSLANAAGAGDAQDQDITEKGLKSLEVPGKVIAVLWTKRSERCTLQIVFPTLVRILQAAPDGSKRHRPDVQAWLLRADGSAIAPIERTEPRGNGRQPFGVEVQLAFPRSADAEAVAVALRVDDRYLIERLPTP